MAQTLKSIKPRAPLLQHFNIMVLHNIISRKVSYIRFHQFHL